MAAIRGAQAEVKVKEVTEWETRAETGSAIGGLPVLRPIGGCLLAIMTWAIVGVVLGMLVMPIDEEVFGASFAATDKPGPCLIVAINGGMAAGALVFSFVVSPQATVWRSLRKRLRRLVRRN